MDAAVTHRAATLAGSAGEAVSPMTLAYLREAGARAAAAAADEEEEEEEEEEKAPEVGEPTSSSFWSLLGSTVDTCSSSSWSSFLYSAATSSSSSLPTVQKTALLGQGSCPGRSGAMTGMMAQTVQNCGVSMQFLDKVGSLPRLCNDRDHGPDSAESLEFVHFLEKFVLTGVGVGPDSGILPWRCRSCSYRQDSTFL